MKAAAPSIVIVIAAVVACGAVGGGTTEQRGSAIAGPRGAQADGAAAPQAQVRGPATAANESAAKPSAPHHRAKPAAAKVDSRHSPAAFAHHVKELKKRLPPGFTVVVEPPFVVIGNDSPERVRRFATATVRWAVDTLKQDYFSRDPVDILDVWLFKDGASYRAHNLRMFGSLPGTPYGYFSSTHKALVMNIATGGGTLVHEIVHPFMEANFPECPAWFNEGLGSLYEQSASRNGHIVGLTNWRLEGLQRAIRRGGLPSFATLTATTSTQFYDADPGTNYAQARYLLFYLQEKGLLVRYYREFFANRKADPTGYETLKRVLGEKDMAAFQKRWEAFVLGLTFP